ncbi:hypothetical protein KVR01_002174 [Diaporthe batatas]|uniref:uncharacterized protein n=1 Tax=Diaporthe batatas TaxID=748121 RepID=UPI001D03788C|nr:uncharacterized protein KVR01_002174 [Diaporthe batatas]KAG8166485.1 hypothetical protein KVR01_002174 [Diaporthe batatas]
MLLYMFASRGSKAVQMLRAHLDQTTHRQFTTTIRPLSAAPTNFEFIMALKQMELESLLVEAENPNFSKGQDDSTVAILPCGHIAGYKCLKQWFEVQQCCPFCRLPMNYQLCKHSSRLIRPLTRENLFGTPETLPAGGHLPPQCYECSIETDASVHKYLLGAMLAQFKSLRTEYNKETHEGKKIDLKSQLGTIKKRIDQAVGELAAYPARARARW